MSNCPYCGADLLGVEHLTVCPACGSSLPPRSHSKLPPVDLSQSHRFTETPQSHPQVDPLADLKAALQIVARRAGESSEQPQPWAGPLIEGPPRVAFTGGAAAMLASHEFPQSIAELRAQNVPMTPGTVPDPQNLGTLDSRGFIKAPLELDSDPVVTETPPDPYGRLAGTVDSDNFPRHTDTKPVVGLVLPANLKIGPAPDPRLAGTIDSNEFPPVAGSWSPDTGGKRTYPELQLARTLDPADVPSADGFDPGVLKTGTLPDRQLARTIDPQGAFKPESEQELIEMWRGTHSPETRPGMTIKGQGTPSMRDSRLVIKPRALRNTTEIDSDPESIDYELLNVIGEGGMGVVYQARQSSIDRTVAIKMLKSDIASNVEQREKFLSEAVVTGDLDHPNIVPIYDLGANEKGALFYSMKRVQGTPWIKVLKDKSLPENIEILMKVADAVGFAHSRGVIHRDLKPENVMLGEFGEVLVMDWGLAMSTSLFRKAGSITQSGSMGGTPAYMAPEMATGPVDRIGPVSDIYLLGAILYEIITFQPPHTGKNVMNCLFAAARNEIQPTNASGELLEIAMQAMSTQPEDRYTGVREFQGAIRLYQSHSESIILSTKAEEELAEAEATGDYQAYSRAVFGFEEAMSLWPENPKARPGLSRARLAYARSAESKGDYDLGYSLLDQHDPAHADLLKAIKAAQRERNARQQRLRSAKLMAAGLVAAILLIVAGAYWQIRQDRDRAITAEAEATKERDLAKLAEARAKVAEGQAMQDRDKAADAAVQAREAEMLAKSAEMQARIDRDKAVQAEKGKEYEAYIARIGSISAKIDENSFEAARELLEECPKTLQRWEWGRLRYLCGQSVRSYDCNAPVDSVSFSPDASRAVTGSWDGKVRIWDVAVGHLERTLDYGGKYVHSVAWSADGKLLAAAGSDPRGYVKVWNADNGELLRTLVGHQDSAVSVTFSSDGRTLLTSSYDRTARLWNLSTGKQDGEAFRGHSWWVWCAAFSPDEKRIVTASQDGSVIVWDRATHKASPPFTGHGAPVYCAAFSPVPGDPHIVSAGYDNRVLVWNPSKLREVDYNSLIRGGTMPPQSYRALEGHTAAVRAVRFSRDGKRLVSASHDNTLIVWDYASGKPVKSLRTEDSEDVVAGKAEKTLRGHAGWIRSCDFSPDARWVISASHDQQAKLWSLEGYEETRVVHVRVLKGHDDAVLAARFSPDGKQIVTASRDRTARIWDFASGKQVAKLAEGHAFLASSAVFFPDGKKVITADMNNSALVWDVTTGTQLALLTGVGRGAVVAVSRDGQRILTGSDDKSAKLWSADGKLLRKLPGETSEVSAVAFSFDGKFLFTGDERGRCMLWNADTGARLWRFEGYGGKIAAAAFLPDGKRVIAGGADKVVGQWDVATGKEAMALTLKHPDAVTGMSMAADGVHAITNCDDGKLRYWDAQRAVLISTLDTRGSETNTVSISPDGRLAATTTLDDRKVRLWDLQTGRERGATRTIQQTPFVDLEPLGASAWSAVFSPDGQRLLTVGGNEARLWQLDSAMPQMTFSPHGAVASANFSADGARLVTGSWDSSAKIWDAATGKAELKLAGGHHGYVNSAVFSPDGKLVLTASDDKTAKVWEYPSGVEVRVLAGHVERVRAAIYSPDGKRILTASSDKSAILWDAETGELVRTFKDHEAGILSCAFSPDGQRIAVGCENNTVYIWNAGNGTPALAQPISGHTAGVTSVAFSRDGDRLLTGSHNFAKLWDARTGVEVLTLKGHTQEITSVCFSDDGRYVLTGSRDGTAIIWLAEPWAVDAVTLH